MAETRSTVYIYIYISTNLTNRANTIKGCIICNPYKTYKTNTLPVMERLENEVTEHLIENRIRDV